MVKKKKNNEAQSSPVVGPAASPASAPAATFLDGLTDADRKKAESWGCTSLEDFKKRQEKMAALEKKALESQKQDMWQNEKKQQWEKEQAKESRKQDKQSQKVDKELERCVQKALKEGVVECIWGNDDKFWAKIDENDWREASGEYYCTLCASHLNYCTLQSHLEGQKHQSKVWNFPGAASVAAPAAPSAKAPPKAAPKAPLGGYGATYAAAAWSPVSKVEEWMEDIGDGCIRCIPCGKVITEEHLCKDDHKNRVDNWHHQREVAKTGYPTPPEEHLAMVPWSDEPGAEKGPKCLLCNKFCQDDWSHAGSPGQPNPTGSKDHLKNLRNYEWYGQQYKDKVRQDKLMYHPELARSSAAPTRSQAASTATKAAAPASVAPWAKAAPAPSSAAPSASVSAAPAAKASPATAAAVARALPEGWTEHEDNNEMFYFHEATNTTQWEFPVGTPEPVLPDGWSAEKDEEGNTFYFHAASNVTQWDKPVGLGQNQGTNQVPLPEGWQQGLSEGHVYYFNQATGEASWEVPS